MNILCIQQDGVPPHYSRPVRNYLGNNSHGLSTGRRVLMELPAHSPDFLHTYTSLSSYLKFKVYETAPILDILFSTWMHWT